MYSNTMGSTETRRMDSLYDATDSGTLSVDLDSKYKECKEIVVKLESTEECLALNGNSEGKGTKLKKELVDCQCSQTSETKREQIEPNGQYEFVDVSNMLNVEKLVKCDPYSLPSRMTDFSSGEFAQKAIKQFCCDVCNKTFKDKSNLTRHKYVHTGGRKFPCEVCKKIFSRKGDFKKHQLVHMEDKSLSCDVCNKSFYRIDRFKPHQLSHTGEKPFLCEVCYKTFSCRDYLQKHMVIHETDNFFSCDVCNKAFSRKTRLEEHLLIHTGEKSFSCHICHKSFFQKSSLQKHVKKHQII